MKTKLYLLLIFINVMSVQHSFSEETMHAPKKILSLNSDIGELEVKEGTMGVELLGVYAKNMLSLGYLLSIDYHPTYDVNEITETYTISNSSWSYTHKNIDQLIEGLNAAKQAVLNKEKYEKEINLGSEWCDRPYDAKISTINDQKNIEIAFYTSTETHLATLSVEDSEKYLNLLQEAKNTVLYVQPQLDAFNRANPKISSENTAPNKSLNCG